MRNLQKLHQIFTIHAHFFVDTAYSPTYTLTMDSKATTTRTIEWATSKGLARVEVSIGPKVSDWGNEISGLLEISTAATLNGEYQGGMVQRINHPTAVARIGSLGLKAETYAAYLAAVADLKATPEWTAYETELAARSAEVADTERRSSAIRRSMSADEEWQ